MRDVERLAPSAPTRTKAPRVQVLPPSGPHPAKHAPPTHVLPVELFDALEAVAPALRSDLSRELSLRAALARLDGKSLTRARVLELAAAALALAGGAARAGARRAARGDTDRRIAEVNEAMGLVRAVLPILELCARDERADAAQR